VTNPTWPNATQCFNCGATERVHRDIGLCESCRTAYVAEKDTIMDKYYAGAKPHYKALDVLEGDRDSAIEELLDKYNIPEDFRR
jgi:hypothetical protein